MNTKICIACGKEFTRKDKALSRWETRKFCSRKCNLSLRIKSRFKKGHKPWHTGTRGMGIKRPNKGSFKKGFIPWNIGRKESTSEVSIRALQEWIKSHGSSFKGRKHTEEAKKIIREKRKLQKNPSGENHWNWKGGTSPLRKRIQALGMYREWRSNVYKRDNWTCQICSKRGGKLNVDHIKPFYKIIEENKIQTIKQTKQCKELWNINNGRTLCVPCHKQTPSYLVNQYTIN